MEALMFKPDWLQARSALEAWWCGEGLALSVTAPAETPHEDIASPGAPRDVEQQWLDSNYWDQHVRCSLSRTFWGGVAAPIYNTMVGGPGSLGLFLGCHGEPQPETMWYLPNIQTPEAHPPLKFDVANHWWKFHLEIIRLAQMHNEGRYLIGYPDLIENMDTLAQLRDSNALLEDLIEKPDWVLEKIDEINIAFFESFNALEEHLRDPWGGNSWSAFQLWAPGKMAKVQCDFSCMISPAMFQEFVVPALDRQCQWLEYSMYHLDGTQALRHLPALLKIEALNAIEWTPQAGLPGGGSPEWYGIYRDIKASGKAVQAIGVEVSEVLPLIEAVGPERMMILTHAATEQEARTLLRRIAWTGEC
jgi:hypothetical protein